MSNNDINLAIQFVKSCRNIDEVVAYIKRTVKRLSSEEVYTGYVLVRIQEHYETHGGELDYLDSDLIDMYAGELENRGVQINYIKLVELIEEWLGEGVISDVTDSETHKEGSPSNHARLSPSSTSRLLACPVGLREEANCPDISGEG